MRSRRAAIIGRYVISRGHPKRQTRGRMPLPWPVPRHTKFVRCLVCTLIIGVRLRAVCQNDDRNPGISSAYSFPFVINLARLLRVPSSPGLFPVNRHSALTAVVLRIEAVRLVSVRRIMEERICGGANDIAEAENLRNHPQSPILRRRFGR